MSSPTPDTGRGKGPQDVRTPAALINVLRQEFPLLGVDLAATADNALFPEFITPEEDTLKQDWSSFTGPNLWGFINPEFGKFGELYAPKFFQEVHRGARFVSLTLASLENDWYSTYFHGQPCEVRILRGRLRFPGYPHSASKGHMITVWDGQPFRAPWPWDWRSLIKKN